MNKNSFLIYLDYQEQFDLLTDEQAGQLIKAIIKYEKTGEITKLDNVTKMAFSFIKTQLDKDREKWKEEKKKRSEAGKKGMTKRWKNDDNSANDNREITMDNKDKSVITDDNKNNSVKSVIKRNNKNN